MATRFLLGVNSNKTGAICGTYILVHCITLMNLNTTHIVMCKKLQMHPNSDKMAVVSSVERITFRLSASVCHQDVLLVGFAQIKMNFDLTNLD